MAKTKRTLSETVADNIHYIAREQKIPQSALAEAAGFSEQMLSQIMNGKKEMPMSRVEPIAKKLGVTPAVLFKERPR